MVSLRPVVSSHTLPGQVIIIEGISVTQCFNPVVSSLVGWVGVECAGRSQLSDTYGTVL